MNRRASDERVVTSSSLKSTDQGQQETAQRRREAQVGKILARLDEREQKVVMCRFGLLNGHEPRTLEDIGAEMGVSKERIRQIQIRALNKLRIAAEEEHIEAPDN